MQETDRSEKLRVADKDGDEDGKEEPCREDDDLEGLAVPCGLAAAAAEQRCARCGAISQKSVHAALICLRSASCRLLFPTFLCSRTEKEKKRKKKSESRKEKKRKQDR